MKSSRITVSVCAFFVVVCFSFAALAADFVRPSQQDKCPVCGMFPYKYPKWIAEIVFTDGTYAAFDGPRDMLRYYFDIPKYNKNKTQGDIAAVYVTEYYTTDLVQAEDVSFVLGSDVHGPMGAEFVPVKGGAGADTFMKDHNGKRVVQFSEISQADVSKIMDHHKKMHGQGHQGHDHDM